MKKELSLRIKGIRPLLLHNGDLADPLNATAKEMKRVSAKRAKTDADLEKMARLEWGGGLYIKDATIVLPADVIEAALVEAARKVKKGKQAQYGISCYGAFPLDFPGKDMSLDKLWESGEYRMTKGVRVQRNRVMRTRPIFNDWAATITVEYDDTAFNESEIRDLVRVAGQVVGICDWRPKYGLFEVV